MGYWHRYPFDFSLSDVAQLMYYLHWVTVANMMPCYRPCFPSICRRSFWPRLGQEALAARQDGEERDAQHGTCCQGEDGSRGMIITSPLEEDYCD